MASTLDPRFKLRYISEDRTASIQEKGPVDSCGGTAEDAPRTSKKKKTLGNFFKVTGTATPRSSPDQEQQAAESELRSYLQCTNLDSEKDPLDWGKEHQKLYPRLFEAGKKVPAHSCNKFHIREGL